MNFIASTSFDTSNFHLFHRYGEKKEEENENESEAIVFVDVGLSRVATFSAWCCVLVYHASARYLARYINELCQR